MTTKQPQDIRAALPDALLETAAVWYARLGEPVNDPAVAAKRQAAFEHWLADDPCHRQAYDETAKLWHALDAPVAQVMAKDSALAERRQRRFRGTRRFGLALCAASLAVIMTVGVLYRSDLWLNADYRTAVGQRKVLTLTDGSRITLNTDSAIMVDLNTQRRQIDLLRGEVWFEVTPDPDRPFLVETSAGQIRVIGTRFGIRLHGDAAIVSLTEGQVKLSAAEGYSNTLVLDPGQQARLSPNGVSSPSAFDPTVASAWLRGQLVFFDTSLRKVITELNRYRSGYIVIANDELNTLKVSGVFATTDPNAALAALTSTLPVRVVRLTDHLVLLR